MNRELLTKYENEIQGILKLNFPHGKTKVRLNDGRFHIYVKTYYAKIITSFVVWNVDNTDNVPMANYMQYEFKRSASISIDTPIHVAERIISMWRSELDDLIHGRDE